jgi:hypothetical protein
MTRTQAIRHADYNLIVNTLRSFGYGTKENYGLKEPELAAATGLDEDRVYRAVQFAAKLGWLEINSNREVLVTAIPVATWDGK